MNDLLERLQISQDARDKADEVMAVLRRVVAETSSEQKVKERERFARRLESLEQVQAAKHCELMARLEASERTSETKAQALDDQHDRMKGLEAREAQRRSHMREEFNEQLESQKAKFEGQLAKADRARREALEAAKALAVVNNGVAEREHGNCEDRTQLRELEAVVMSSREHQSRLTDELSELRLQMLGMSKGDDDRVDDMQRQAWEVQEKATSSGGRRSRIGKIRSWHQGSKLTSIEEEDADNNSADDASENLSGADAGEVGNLDDFDGEAMDEEEAAGAGGEDRSQEHRGCASKHHSAMIEQLKDQLSQCRRENSELKENLAGREAELESKVERLTESLRVSKEEVLEVIGAAKSEATEVSEETTADVEALQHKLFLAMEAKRIAGIRMEDMRQELEATQRRCEQTTSELRKTESTEAQLSGNMAAGASEAEMKELVHKLHTVEEERNVLKHTLEWKEVQWQSKMEHMELENADLKRQHEAEMANLKKELNDTVADFKRKLDEAEQEKANLARSMGEAAGAGGGGFLALLRCPTRSDASSSSSSGSGKDPAHCREVGWRLLRLVPAGMALLCEVPGLKVLDVTDQAKSTWGDGLPGSLVVSLLGSPTSAAWLRRAIVTHQNLASLDGSPGDVPGFAVHPLGRLDFRDSSGQIFESAVTVAHLPCEPKLGKAATVIIIMEPAPKPEPPRRASGSRRSAIGSGTRAGSAVLSAVGGCSVVSDDVLPSDSASQIAARYM